MNCEDKQLEIADEITAMTCVVFMGHCGVGKSTLANEMFGTHFRTGDGEDHVTVTKEQEIVCSNHRHTGI